jgi:hypothetical protein
MPRLSAVGISGLQAGEDVKNAPETGIRPVSRLCVVPGNTPFAKAVHLAFQKTIE